MPLPPRPIHSLLVVLLTSDTLLCFPPSWLGSSALGCPILLAPLQSALASPLELQAELLSSMMTQQRRRKAARWPLEQTGVAIDSVEESAGAHRIGRGYVVGTEAEGNDGRNQKTPVLTSKSGVSMYLLLLLGTVASERRV